MLHQGILLKLNTGSDPSVFANWLQRDMWISSKGHLCYFSQKEFKRLVLLDVLKLHNCVISDYFFQVPDLAWHGFQIEVKCQDEPSHVHAFACASVEEREGWKSVLNHVSAGEIQQCLSKGTLALHEVLHLKLHVQNHRTPVKHDAGGGFEPFLKGYLWKLKAEGDPHDDKHWLHRHMWLSKNGSFVYWSEKEDRDLVCRTSSEICRASVRKVSKKDTCKLWAIALISPPNGDLEFAPSLFAADSMDERDRWLEAFSKFTCFAHTGQANPIRKESSKSVKK